LFYKRALELVHEKAQKMQPYATLAANQIGYHLECTNVGYLVEPSTSILVEKPTPYYYYFQLPLTDEVIQNMPYPATFPSSRGPQTRIKITLKFLLTNTNKQQTDVFDQFPSISRLVNNIVREHLAREPVPSPSSPSFQPMPSTSASTTNPAPFYQHSWKKRGKRRL
jgi:hypothetical protein